MPPLLGRGSQPRRFLPFLLITALACLVAGLTLPIMEVSNFWIFHGTYSILDGIIVLLEQGDILIAAVIIAFSILVPALKIMALLGLWQQIRQAASRRGAVRPSVPMPYVIPPQPGRCGP